MKKLTDKDIIRTTAGKSKAQKGTDLTTFRKQFGEYHRAKAAKQTDAYPVCRPYSRAFHHTNVQDEP